VAFAATTCDGNTKEITEVPRTKHAKNPPTMAGANVRGKSTRFLGDWNIFLRCLFD
jgi:hypothetical protein